MAALSLLFVPGARAEGKWSGYMFGDLYWFAAHHADKYKGQNGLWFRRIYLAYDHDLSEEFTTRLRLEASQADFTAASSEMTPFLKDAYLQWKKGTHNAFFGLSPSPTWDEVESFWGYRAVEKTPLDLQKWGGSRDVGLAARGDFDAGKAYGYHAMVGNGIDTKSETNKTKKTMLALDAKAGGGFYAQVYGDYETNKSATPGSSAATYQVFGGWKGDAGRVGLQYAHQWRGLTAAPDLHLDIVSAFGVAKFTDAWSAFARWDYHMDPNPDLSTVSYLGMSGAGRTDTNTAKNTLLVFGLDHARADGKVHLMPNAEIFLFGKNAAGARPVPVVIPRLTAYWQFK